MSYFLLLVEQEIKDVKSIIKLRAASIEEKPKLLAESPGAFYTKYYFFNDKDLAEHLENMQKQFSHLISNININQAYEK